MAEYPIDLPDWWPSWLFPIRQELLMTEPSLTDLDRCQHGRHSLDTCFDCPGGKSIGNEFLDPSGETVRVRETRMDRNEIRIGTTYDQQPIWVCYRRLG